MKKVISLLLAVVMVLSMASGVFAAETAFKDVAETAYYYKPVMWAVENKITAGTGDGYFSPNYTCTRAHVVTFLWNLAGNPEVEADVENPFTDVPEGKWYTEAVLWAVQSNITAGLTETTFGPDKSCTRAQVVSFLHRYAMTPDHSVTKNPFADVADGKWYTDAVLWAVESGVTAGTSEGKFSPDATCTRGQVVSFLYRYDGNQVIFVVPGETETLNVPAGETRNYMGYLSESTMTIEGAGDGVVVTYNGEAVDANADGNVVIKFPAAAGMGRPMPNEFSVTNNSAEDAAYVVTFTYPEGHVLNPAEIAIGPNSVEIEAGTQGYNYAYTAEADGYLVITMSGEGWSYELVNSTKSISCDSMQSNSNPLATTATMLVETGDVVNLVVNTYDPANAWEAPEGEVSFTAAFAAGTEEDPISFEVNTASAFNVLPISVGAGESVYVNMGASTGYVLSLDEEDAVIVYDETEYTSEDSVVLTHVTMGMNSFVLKNVAEEGTANWNLAYDIYEGHELNPIELTVDDILNGSFCAEQKSYHNYGVNYVFTAPCDMTLNLEKSYIETTSAAALTVTFTSGEESADDTISIPVKKDGTVKFSVLAGFYGVPVDADVYMFVGASDAAAGTIVNPLWNYGSWPMTTDSIPAGETVWYNTYGAAGLDMAIENANAAIIHGGVTYTAVEGVVTAPITSPNPRMPALVGIKNVGTEAAAFEVEVKIPVGSMDNPDELKVGANTVAIEAGSQGYFYEYINEEQSGTLTITIDESCKAWTYVVNNVTAGNYGDTHWSDDDPVVATETVAYTAGDVVQVIVNTYDSDSYSSPAGEIVINVNFTPAE